MRITLLAMLLLSLLGSSVSSLAADFQNHEGIAFATIPAGEFFMGSCSEGARTLEENRKRKFLGLEPVTGKCPAGTAISGSDKKRAFDEQPAQKVTIRKPFQFAAHQISIGVFKRFIRQTGREDLVDFMFRFLNKGDERGTETPVRHISWQSATDFVNWLNATKPASDAGLYRLPSEAEWEYVARAGKRDLYDFFYCRPFSGSVATDILNFERDEARRLKRDATVNSLGVYDLGNCDGEVVQDCHSIFGYKDAPKDGSAHEKGVNAGCRFRVVRNWLDAERSPRQVRLTIRGYTKPESRAFTIRVVRQLP